MKKVLFTMILALVVMTSSLAFASPVELNGEASYQFRHDTATGNAGDSGNVTKFILNAKTGLTTNLSLYTRFAYEGYTTVPSSADFNTDLYSHRYAAGIDQFGLLYENKNFAYKVGRQSVTIGETGLLYDTQWKIGKNQFSDGVTVATNLNGYNLKAVVAQENNVGSNDHKIYALSAKKLVGEVTLGAVAARYKDQAKIDSSNNYAVNAGYQYGKANFYGEYGVSDASDKNKAYVVGVKYNVTNKDNIFINSYKVEANADMGKKTSFNNNQKGVYYGGWHSFDKSTGMLVEVWNNSTLETQDKDTSVRTTLVYNF